MERYNHEIRRSVEVIHNAAKAGNHTALTDLPQQILDLTDSLDASLDKIVNLQSSSHIQHMNKAIKDLEHDVRDLRKQYTNFVNIVAQKHNDLADEVMKLHRVLNFVLGDKAPEELRGK